MRSSGVETPKATPAGTLAAMEDGTLLALVGQGDENAMATLFDRYSRVVYSVALRVLRDPSAAEDVLQDAFMHLWRKPDAVVVNRGAIGAWLAVVARNRSIDMLRRQKPSESVEEVALPSGVDVAVDAERTYLMERVRALIGRMPVEQRKTLEMAFFDGLTHSEIADTTGDPLGTVKTRIRTALLSLRKAMVA
ncbi:RNA polymerase sigma factor [Terriglobus aquaticus]|uniref:RNA polymerase sigma factor n=1 Tax=Terriglobus aquaticus TaxID=940139 RepID=A0ABW9KNS3_9BACT